MRNIFILSVLLTIASSTWAVAQERVTSELNVVSVFSKGAQVNRSAKVTLKAGEQTIIVTGLSPYTDTKTMQVSATDGITILGMNCQKHKADSAAYEKSKKEIEEKIKAVDERLKTINAEAEVLTETESLLKDNCNISKMTAVTPTIDVRELTPYYRAELMKLKESTLANKREKEKADEERNKLVDELVKLAKSRKTPETEVVIKIDAPRQMTTTLGLRYYVSGAGWYPTYDIRSAGIGKPIQVSYKANIYQKTDEKWENTKVTLSSTDPNLGSIAPVLKKWNLGYGLQPPTYPGSELTYGKVANTAYGRITDEEGAPVPGVVVELLNEGIHAISDVDGNYSITLKGDSRRLQFSFIGYQTKVLSVPSSGLLNVTLEEDEQELAEVVVVGYGYSRPSRASRHANKTAAADVANEAKKAKSDKIVKTSEKQTVFGYIFEIETPLTIQTDGTAKTTEIARFELPTSYALSSAPKVDKDAFIMAQVTDWESRHLLSGEATVYFDGTYVGKTIVDPTSETDTLSFSLGRDKQVVIKREKTFDNKKRRVIGLSQEKTIEWCTTVRNTHKEPVELILTDQVPVSTDSDIKVEVEELSSGSLNPKSGIITWRLNLSAGESRKLTLRYTVKYSKNRNLILE